MNIILWVLQSLMALLFLFAGVSKLVMSPEAMQEMSSPNTIVLSTSLIRFLGVVEILGALGLILPGLTKIRRGLTPLAALGLLIIMIGAIILAFMGPGAKDAIFPFVTGLICVLIAYGRRDWR